MTIDQPKYKAIILGLGQIGMGYDYGTEPNEQVLSHAQALNIHQGFDLIAAVDPDTDKRRAFQNKFSKPAYISAKELYQATPQPIDVVIIATPTEQHLLDITEACLHSPKLIVCEKPLAEKDEDAKQIVELCKNSGCHLLVNYMRRSEPGTRAVGHLIQKGQLGTQLKGIVWYSKGLRHNGSHFIELLQHWLGKVQSFQIIKPLLLENGDCASDVCLLFGDTPLYFLSRDETAFSYYSIELMGELGQIRYDDGGFQISQRTVEQRNNLKRLSNQKRIIKGDMNRYQLHAAEAWYQFLSGDENAPICSYQDALSALHVANQIIDTTIVLLNNHSTATYQP